MAGRRLANRFRSLRIANRPRSGRSGRSRLSYCGLPTAPSRTAGVQALGDEFVEYADGFGDDFGADAVASEDGDMFGHDKILMRVWKRGGRLKTAKRFPFVRMVFSDDLLCLFAGRFA